MAGKHAVEMLENAQLLPPSDAMDRILRYQSAERRHLFRLLGELRQVQTERRGKAVQPALKRGRRSLSFLPASCRRPIAS